MLVFDPSRRLTALEALRSDFFSSGSQNRSRGRSSSSGNKSGCSNSSTTERASMSSLETRTVMSEADPVAQAQLISANFDPLEQSLSQLSLDGYRKELLKEGVYVCTSAIGYSIDRTHNLRAYSMLYSYTCIACKCHANKTHIILIFVVRAANLPLPSLQFCCSILRRTTSITIGQVSSVLAVFPELW